MKFIKMDFYFKLEYLNNNQLKIIIRIYNLDKKIIYFNLIKNINNK